jgi:hypothetical protein
VALRRNERKLKKYKRATADRTSVTFVVLDKFTVIAKVAATFSTERERDFVTGQLSFQTPKVLLG